MDRVRRYLPHTKVIHTNYFRMTAEEDGCKFTLTIGSAVTTNHFLYVEYSIDEGENWTRTYNVDRQKVTITMPTINTGQSVIMKGVGRQMGMYYKSSAEYSQIKSNSKKFNVSGVLMALLKGEFSDKNTLLDETTDYSFRTLFENTKITHADKLIMPPNATKDCFNSMFKGCTELVSAPLLQALVLYQGSYKNMFNGCSKLNYIKMLATDITLTTVPNAGERALAYWCTGVSANGTFVKNKDATWNVRGDSGVPSGWAIITE